MFKKSKIALSVVAGVMGVMGIMTSAEAVHVNPDGTGQVLLFPYYSARPGYVTNINVVNSTDQTKAVKIRYRESKTSKDMLDFNVYMSPHDVWTSSIQPYQEDEYDAKGKKTGKKTDKWVGSVTTSDRSCTFPLEMAATCDTGTCQSVKDFHGYRFFKDKDGNFLKPEDTQEGYVEIIEMGVVEDQTVADGVLHENGKPTNCSVLTKAWLATGVFGKDKEKMSGGMSAPTGGLFGHSAVLNVTKGTAFAVDPVTIDNYSTIAQHVRPDDIKTKFVRDGVVKGDDGLFSIPTLASGDVTESRVLTKNANGEAELVVTKWDKLKQDYCGGLGADKAGLDGDVLTPSCGDNPYPVSHVLSAPAVMNEYFLDPSNEYDGHTDWVVTFPMKKYGIQWDAATDITAKVDLVVDREEGNGDVPTEEAYFSPPIRPYICDPITDDECPPPDRTVSLLGREVNVISFKSTDPSYDNTRTVLSSDSGQTFKVGDYVSGWARLAFPDYSLTNNLTLTSINNGALTQGFLSAQGYGENPGTYTKSSKIYQGVPTVGAAFIDGKVVDNNKALFGNALPHKISRQ